jgi:hypothetical protein
MHSSVTFQELLQSVSQSAQPRLGLVKKVHSIIRKVTPSASTRIVVPSIASLCTRCWQATLEQGLSKTRSPRLELSELPGLQSALCIAIQSRYSTHIVHITRGLLAMASSDKRQGGNQPQPAVVLQQPDIQANVCAYLPT